MSLTAAIRLMRRIRDEVIFYDSLTYDERIIADCLMQGGFVYITGNRRLRLTTHGAEIVALDEELENFEKNENLDDIAKDLISEISYYVECGDYPAAMFRLFELYHVLDALMYKQGRLII